MFAMSAREPAVQRGDLGIMKARRGLWAERYIAIGYMRSAVTGMEE